MRTYIPWLLLISLVACDTSDTTDTSTATSSVPAASVTGPSAPNILVLIADDVGVEQIASFDIGTAPAITPNLDSLAARGMQFSRVWSQPLCSPTRATLLTGRYGFRNQVGLTPMAPGVQGPYPVTRGAGSRPPERRAGAPYEFPEVPIDAMRYLNQYRPEGTVPHSFGLPQNEIALPQLLRASGYATAVFGKWHLGDTRNGWLEHPGAVGFEHYSVNMHKAPEGYFRWWENVNGTLEERTGYTPQRKIDDAIDWLDGRDGGDDRPWFLWMAFNLAHYPHHVPEVQGIDTSGVSAEDPHAALDVMIARLDEEIGRLLGAIGDEALENTIVVFMGDNGTTGNSIDPLFHPDRAKFTLYEGGLRVPLIFAGPGVPAGESSDVLVNTTDFFATITQLAGAALPQDTALDSVSLLPYFANPSSNSIRTYLYSDAWYTEYGLKEGAFAVRDAEFKLVSRRQGPELYDVGIDPYENSNLLADGISASERAAMDRLEDIAEALHRSGE